MKIEWNIETNLVSSEMYSLIQTAADCAMAAENIRLSCAVGIHIVSDEKIQQINKEFRGINQSTDVLSFPQVCYKKGKTAKDAIQSLKQEYDDSLKAVMLGDLFFSMEHIIAQAKEYNHTLEREGAYLCVHGVFHLFGYDHLKEDKKQEMRKMEEKALNIMGLGNGGEKPTDEQLLHLARQAMEKSYSPYSNYPVGAALLAKDGRVYQGCNVENASFGLSNCGERTAVFKAVSEGVKEFEAIAIASKNSAPWPCGACRQVLNEFAPGIRVLVTWADGKTDQSTLDDLLPHGFGPKDLPKK